MKTDVETENTNKITRTVIGCAMRVLNALGTGFLEKVYENALVLELEHHGLTVDRQKSFRVRYRDTVVGLFVPDLIVEDTVIVEMKAVKAVDAIHQAQILNYLRASNLKIGLILNFGTTRLGVKRLVVSNPVFQPSV